MRSWATKMQWLSCDLSLRMRKSKSKSIFTFSFYLASALGAPLLSFSPQFQLKIIVIAIKLLWPMLWLWIVCKLITIGFVRFKFAYLCIANELNLYGLPCQMKLQTNCVQQRNRISFSWNEACGFFPDPIRFSI